MAPVTATRYKRRSLTPSGLFSSRTVRISGITVLERRQPHAVCNKQAVERSVLCGARPISFDARDGDSVTRAGVSFLKFTISTYSTV